MASAIYPAEFTVTDVTPENPLLEDINKIVATLLQICVQMYRIMMQILLMLDTVRNSLQGLANGNSAAECVQHRLWKK